MSLTFNSKTYTGQSYQGLRVVYNGTAKTVSTKDDLLLAATPPKASSAFSGVGRTDARMTRTLELTDALTPTGDVIVDIQVSVPVGASSTDVDAVLTDMGAFLSSSDFKTHVKAQKVAF